MTKITIFTLTGCDKCASLKSKLNENSIAYKEISCEECPECCDSVEDTLNITRYPIAKMEVNGKIYYGHVNESYGAAKQEFIPNIYSDSFLSIDRLFEYIKSKVNV